MNENINKNTAYSTVILGLVAAFLAVPIFVFFYKYVPTFELTIFGKLIRLDHIILFMITYFVLYYLLKKLKFLIYILLFGSVLTFTVANFSDVYTFSNLSQDYKSILFDLSNHSFSQDFFKRELKFKQEDRLRVAIDYKTVEVRNYAVNIANFHFDKDRHLAKKIKWVHFFSVFKEINSKWNYVYDPLAEEYYSKASETLIQLEFDGTFKGDCDDHSIMMAACIKAVGGEVRLVRTTITTKDGIKIGHLYPEVKIGDTKDLEVVVYLIKNVYFKDETIDKTIHYYQDPKGFVWLNFDYNDLYPGNKYQSDVRDSEIEI